MELRETIYEHVTGNNTFTVTASEPWSVGMINRLKEKFPNEVQIIHTNADGSIITHIPFEWMRILPKKKVELSEEQRKTARERLNNYRKSVQQY